MSTFLVTCPHPLCDDGTISNFRKNHSEIMSFTEPEEVVFPQQGLFDVTSAVEVLVDTIPAADIRNLASQAQHQCCDLMIITRIKNRGKFTKDGITVIDCAPPERERDFVYWLSERTGVPPKVAAYCIKSSSDEIQAIVVARQAALLNGRKIPRGSFIESRGKEAPPWDVIDSILDGDIFNALGALSIVAPDDRSATSTAIALCSYMRKAVVASRDTSGFIQQGKLRFFRDKSRLIKDKNAMIQAIDGCLSDILGRYRNPSAILRAYVISMCLACSQPSSVYRR